MSEKLPNELNKIIKEGEGIATELKTATDELPKSLFETICAFLNRFGGHIFLGVKDDGEISGVDRDAIPKMKKDFANLCNNEDKIKPTIYLTLEDYEIDGKTILHVYVPEGSDVYMINRSKIYDRNMDGDYLLTNSGMVHGLYDRKNTNYYENKVFPYATMDDLREDVFKEAKALALGTAEMRTGKREHPWGKMTNEEILKSLDLYGIDPETGKEGLILAAILLFGNDHAIINALPYHRTDAIYRAVDMDRYDDRDDIRTNLIDSYYRLMEFCDKHLDSRFYLNEEGQRIDIINIIAREVCVNLLIHRNLRNPMTPQLIIYKDDKIVTKNANRPTKFGKLDLKNITANPKNPKIAKAFHEMGLADELGSGTRNLEKYVPIYSNGKQAELIEEDIFTTIIPINYTDGTTLSTTLTKKKTTLSTTLPDTDINNNQKKILELISKNKKISQEEIAKNLGMTIDGVKYNMKELRKKGIIKRVGRKNDGYWQIIK